MEELKTGSDLKKWRKKHHISQKELAAKITYSASRISHIEYTNTRMSKKLIHQIKNLEATLITTKKNPISERWDSISYLRNIYDIEMKTIEEGLLRLLDININKWGINKTEAYLKFLGAELISLSKVNEFSFESTKDEKNQL